ncbi:putative uncharacterized protein DDB_G0290521 [Triplophysa rosa]|uniref:putative uncharacterized protein DDB_G0290521 n=1 Tax=Triplophysa rosa TaxID=992332 RepID=UPI002545F9D4|nr:putative uncharacterized protein DDB_G0290521 [Triplophysa rosa]
MSENEIIPIDNSVNDQGPLASSSDGQHSSARQDTSDKPAAAPRGRRPSRASSTTARRSGAQSPPPSRQPSRSPASSYASIRPAYQNVDCPRITASPNQRRCPLARRMNKAELYGLYSSLQPDSLAAQPATPFKATGKPRQVRNSPYLQPDQTPTRRGRRSESRRSGPSASLGRTQTPDPPACSLFPFSRAPAGSISGHHPSPPHLEPPQQREHGSASGVGSPTHPPDLLLQSPSRSMARCPAVKL